MAVSFIGGGNQSTWRKPPTCRKSLTNNTFIYLSIYMRGLASYSHVEIFFTKASFHKEGRLTQPLIIDVPVPCLESEQSCICVLEVSNLPLSTIFSIGFWKCSNSVVFFVFHFFIIIKIKFQCKYEK